MDLLKSWNETFQSPLRARTKISAIQIAPLVAARARRRTENSPVIPVTVAGLLTALVARKHSRVAAPIAAIAARARAIAARARARVMAAEIEYKIKKWYFRLQEKPASKLHVGSTRDASG